MFAILAGLAVLVGANPALRQWSVDGTPREALVYQPANPRKAPLVFVFHGQGGTMRNAARRMNPHDHWPEAMVVYPQGLPTKGQLTDPEGKRPGWQSMAGAVKFFQEHVRK